MSQNRIDREGIFRAYPTAWRLKEIEGKQSKAVNIDFAITEELDGEAWNDWSGYDVVASGDWWIISKEGKVNEKSIQQLAQSLGWEGDLLALTGPPPDVLVQISIKSEEYNGKTYFKASWMNPGDYVPQARTTSAEDVQRVGVQFSSLIRAAASTVKKGAKPMPRAAAAPTPSARPVMQENPNADAPVPDDNIPF